MKLLVFGKDGQVGKELLALSGPGVEITALGRAQADLSVPGACTRYILEAEVDAVINAAAYTAVDRAEAEEHLAMTVNADAPGIMAEAAAQRGLPFLHLSTDYVFPGLGCAPSTPETPTAPVNAYGRTKLAGERAVRSAGGTHVILRTSWVFSAHGSNFVKSMLRLGKERSELRIVSDQIGGPTPACSIAESCVEIAGRLLDAPEKSGTYHYAGTPDVSWSEFAREIFRQAGLNCAITEIPSSDYPVPAARPLNSRLDCCALAAVFGISRPDWRDGLARVLREIGET